MTCRKIEERGSTAVVTGWEPQEYQAPRLTSSIRHWKPEHQEYCASQHRSTSQIWWVWAVMEEARHSPCISVRFLTESYLSRESLP